MLVDGHSRNGIASSDGAKVLLYYRKESVRTAASNFISRGPWTLRDHQRVDGFLEELEVKIPAVVIVDFFLPKTSFERMRQILSLPAYSHVQAVLVSYKPERSEYLLKAMQLPRARLVSEGPRFIPRIVEAVAEALGSSQRRHLPERYVQGFLVSPKGQVPIEIENISETGAKVCCTVALPAGAEIDLQFTYKNAAFFGHAIVVRHYLDPKESRRHLGLQFVGLDPRRRDVLRAILNEMPGAKEQPIQVSVDNALRSFPRTLVPPQLDLKARINPIGKTTRTYMVVTDISEGGFAARSTHRVNALVGQQIETLFLWKGQSFSAQCEMVREMEVVMPSATSSWHYGARFLTLNRYHRARLIRLLAMAKERGLSGQRILNGPPPYPASRKHFNPDRP